MYNSFNPSCFTSVSLCQNYRKLVNIHAVVIWLGSVNYAPYRGMGLIGCDV